MAHQIPGTATATYQQTAPFPSLSRRQDNPYQHHGNGKRSVPLQKHPEHEPQAESVARIGHGGQERKDFPDRMHSVPRQQL